MGQETVQGEGNYEAAKQYDEATEKFVKSGKVDEAAHAAAPHDEREAAEMLRAENEGKRHAKGEDRLLQKGAQPDAESKELEKK